jgi:hypothetical protein
MESSLTSYLCMVKERLIERRQITITHVTVDKRTFDRLLSECDAKVDEGQTYCIQINAPGGWLTVERSSDE